MESSGLRWLVGGGWPFCLVFVRGVSEDQVFRAFGADPGDVIVCGPGESPQDVAGVFSGPSVRVGRAGKWIIAIEDEVPPQGIRPEVLRRVSSGGEAVALYADIGKLNHQFGYAADGDVVATLTTSFPRHWSGSDPGQFESLARELGLTDDAEPPDGLTELEAVVSLAERAFGLSVTQADLERPLPCARVMPVLEDLPPRLLADSGFWIGDPVIDVLLKWGDPPTLAAVGAIRMRRLMVAAGLDAYPELAAAAEAAATGAPQAPTDAGPTGKVLRRIARDQSEAEHYLTNKVNQPPPIPEAELQHRVRQGNAASLLRLLLSGRPPAQLLAAELQQQRVWDAQGWQEPLAWRAQAIADFSGVEVPAADLRAAEEAWLAEPEPVRGRWGMIDAEPVRAHVRALIDAGMDPRRIAELGGVTTVFFDDILLPGRAQKMPVSNARNLLAISLPDTSAHQPPR